MSGKSDSKVIDNANVERELAIAKSGAAVAKYEATQARVSTLYGIVDAAKIVLDASMYVLSSDETTTAISATTTNNANMVSEKALNTMFVCAEKLESEAEGI